MKRTRNFYVGVSLVTLIGVLAGLQFMLQTKASAQGNQAGVYQVDRALAEAAAEPLDSWIDRRLGGGFARSRVDRASRQGDDRSEVRQHDGVSAAGASRRCARAAGARARRLRRPGRDAAAGEDGGDR